MCFGGGTGQKIVDAAIPAAIGAGSQLLQSKQGSNVGAINPAQLQSPEERALLQQQVAFSQAVTPLEQQFAQATLPLQQQFQETAIPLATQQLSQIADFEGSRLGLGQQIAEGGQLPGMFAGLGQGVGSTPAEEEQLRRIREGVETQQQALGTLSSGATSELTQQGQLQFAIANQENQRRELFNLLSLIQGGGIA